MYLPQLAQRRRATQFPGRPSVWLAGLLVAGLGCVGSVGGSAGSTPSSGNGPSGTTTPGSTSGGGTGPDAPGPGARGPGPTTCPKDQIGLSPMRRLTRVEYDNSIHDLLGVDLALSHDFSDDELAGSFPANYFNPISDSQYGQYATAAATAAGKAVETIATLLPCAAATPIADEAGCAGTFIKQFGRRAYRRPLTDSEVANYQKLFTTGHDGGDFASGIELVVEGMLESPYFLYLVEGPGDLTQHQLAARLSYFLWKGPPDAELAQLADGGKLSTVEALTAQAKRLLADPRAADMLADFNGYWLSLGRIDTVAKDDATVPDWAGLKPYVREETRRFVSAVLAEGDGTLATLFSAPYSIVNGPLAKLYGVSGPTGTEDWQKVDLDPKQRAGVLTQASFLSANGTDLASPVHRGLAVREQILCSDLPPPPPGADANLPAKSATKTTRQRLEQHRATPECASCHTLMDSIGNGFEGYDEIGRYRTTENGTPVDTSGQLVGTDVDGPFQGAIELGQRLAKSKQVQSCLVSQWFRYALGRLETDLDRCTLTSLTTQFQSSGLKVPDLLLALVQSDAFRIRRAEDSK